MPISFIALQCFQCSTMQVKQQKKSSNKWNCVVCNQKQSVRKVFVQAFMAKDVRKFVQNFNMSRQLSDQKQSPSEELEGFDSPKDEQKRKRNDWTEYVDDQEECIGKFNEDGDCAQGEDEPVVVTEMPKAVFKKPKVKDYSSNGHGSKNLFKPLIPKSRNARRHHTADSQCELGNFDVSFDKGAEENRDSKWSRLRAQIQDDYSNVAVNREKRFLCERAKGIEDKAISKEPVAPPHRISKWSSFINEEDDEDLENGGRRGSWDRRPSKQSDYQFDPLVNDERVEDDIHPDFL